MGVRLGTRVGAEFRVGTGVTAETAVGNGAGVGDAASSGGSVVGLGVGTSRPSAAGPVGAAGNGMRTRLATPRQ